MISVKKDFDDIPNILRSKNREDAFVENISNGSYVDTKNLYKVGSVQKKLNELYHLKCAYCEKNIGDSSKHIEHYRPKKIYYWLAYSWDNLLLSCGKCNSAKSDKFLVDNQIEYANEVFLDIHNLGYKYDTIEKPYIVNPERTDVLEKIIFDRRGNILSKDKRVSYTIETCNLNRKSLVDLRVERVCDFIEEMENHLFYYKKNGDVSRFIPTIQLFLNACHIENEFYAFNYFVRENIDIFFEDKKLQHIIKMVIKRVNEK